MIKQHNIILLFSSIYLINCNEPDNNNIQRNIVNNVQISELNGHWFWEEDAGFHFKFNFKDNESSIEYINGVEGIVYTRVRIKCGSDQVCIVLNQSEKYLLLSFEIINSASFFLEFFPEEMVSISDYKTNKVHHLPMRFPISSKFVR